MGKQIKNNSEVREKGEKEGFKNRREEHKTNTIRHGVLYGTTYTEGQAGL